MRFSRNWIADYTDLTDDTQALCATLSMLGLVVDDARSEGDDLSLDLDLPSNRPDVLNHYGLAREIAIALDADLRPPADEVDAPGDPTTSIAGVQVEDPTACPRFAARAIVDVEVKPSPDWMSTRLESIGLRPINNVVDVTNFVMWELGRPMHAYDLDKLADGQLIVRRPRGGERLVTLDEVEHKLTADDLIIADPDRAVGLAGVMGGAETGVTESTRRVLLECAYFDPVTIRRMSRRCGFHTDASHRFERDMSPQGISAALRRACHLITLLGGGIVSSEGIDVLGSLPERRSLVLRAERLRGYLGVEIPAARVTAILSALGFEVSDAGGDYGVVVPPRRVDVWREEDLIEEIARFHGYDQLPSTLPLLRRRDTRGASDTLRHERHVKDICAAAGYWEAMTFAFTSAAEQAPFLNGETPLALINPISEAMGVMRTTMLPGLLAAVARNRNRGARRVRLFEVGRTFHGSDEGPPIERRALALAACGSTHEAHFAAQEIPTAFGELKGTLETLRSRMRWPRTEWAAAQVPGLQPGTTAEIRVGELVVGIAGKIDPDVAAALGVHVAVWAAEIDLGALMMHETSDFSIDPLPRYPASERDVTILLDEHLPFGRVETEVATLQGIPLAGLRLLDLYIGDDVPDGRLAATLRLTYRADDRTLTTEEIETAQARVVDHLERSLGATRR